MRATMRFLSSGASGTPSVSSMPRLPATSFAGSSMRVRPCFGVLDQQAPADRDRGGRDDLAVLDQGELGGAAADVDVEDRAPRVARERDGARAVRRQLAFHVMAGGGADEAAGLLREQVRDGARIVALDGLAGQDHGAAIDATRIDVGIGSSNRR